ncbi:MAG TPA: methionine--tRNA ligase subunit beta, partial [Flavobacteriia bacterium]|nr:methionine--tRNA ligase subunit beta [Flavobacteriia bacterium]
VAVLGNFINRVVVLTNKYYNGIVPKPAVFNTIDDEVFETIKIAPKKIGKSIERFRFREALNEMMQVARIGNKYLADEEPWKKIKTDEERTKTIMYVALQIATALSVLTEPFLPFTAKKLQKILQLTGDLSWKDIQEKDVLLPENHQIGKAELLFSKIEDAEIQKQITKLEATKKENQAIEATISPQKETISFDDFTKLDMRIGTILEAEKVPKTKKLLKLLVDVGVDKRIIVSGIAESFKPEDIIGQKVTVLINLAPRKIKGIESQGMILMSDTKDGKLTFIEPEKDSINNGAYIS